MRKRSMEDDQDAEMDQGRVKKVKKYREEAHAYRGGQNPFQVVELNLFIRDKSVIKKNKNKKYG